MFSYCTNYAAAMPDIKVYMNCDTQLAINLRMFNLSDTDELIFTVKNYNFINSAYVFQFRAKKADMDKNGEVIFKIPAYRSKLLKPGAFYNFTVLLNAFDIQQETEYRKLTSNGNIILDYGAQDLLIDQEVIEEAFDNEIVSIRLEPISLEEGETADRQPNALKYEILSMRLEPLEEV